TAVGGYIFRACFIAPFQGYVIANFASDTLKLNRAAILRAVRSDYSVGQAKVFNAKLIKLGPQLVDSQSYQSGDDDFKTQLTNITMDEKRNASKPAVVLKVGKGGKYESSGRIQPEGVKETNPAEAPRPGAEPKKTEGNTAPNPAPGSMPTPTPAPATGSTSSA